jgi:hypothetical protein
LIHVPPREQIQIRDIAKVCDGKRVIHVSAENAREWFENSEHLDPYVLVSTCSDFSLRLQAEHHPNEDIEHLSMRAPWADLKAARGHYSAIQVGPCCDPKQCSSTDKYVMKVDNMSACTFNDIPDNVVRWFCTNLDVEHPRIEWLPFGLNDDGPGASYVPEFMEREKTGLAYANFQNNTMGRVRLNRWAENQSWLTHRPPASLPIREFLADVASHKFTLCPFGNGLDCYRIYEALYLGSVPILEPSRFSRYLAEADLPVLVVDSFYSLRPEHLETVYESILEHKHLAKPDMVTKGYWHNRITEVARSL